MAIDLRALREVLGLDAQEAAALARLTPSQVLEAEERPDDHLDTVGRLLGAYGLSEASAADHAIAPSQSVSEAGLFFFRGDHTVIEADDLPQIARGLRWARIWAASPASASAQERRRAVQPRRVVAEHPRAAAKQGYLLARWIRRLLELHADPIEDLRAVTERSLGITVTSAHFASQSLRAAAIIARQRSAAAIVVREAAAGTGARVRVNIAHELCHALFDVEYSAGATFALDHVESRPGESLIEARARGFAAELLVPLAGLRGLLGEPQAVGMIEAGAAMVTRCCDHFRAPPALTTYHLSNHGYLDRLTRDRLLDRHESRFEGLVDVPVEAPPVGRPPMCVSALLTAGEALDLGTAEVLARTAEQAWMAARDRAVSVVVREAVALGAEGIPESAGLILSRLADDALRGRDRGLLAALFKAVERADLPDGAVRALLVNTRAADLDLPERWALIDRLSMRQRASGRPEASIAAFRTRMA